MGTILGLLGLFGLLFGLFNLFRPTGRLKVTDRRRAGWSVGGSVGVILLATGLAPGEVGGVDETSAATTTATVTAPALSATPSSTTTTVLPATTTILSTTSVPAVVTTFGKTAGPSQPETALPPSAVVVRVASIRDGDTIEVVFPDGTTQTVRLIGVNAPEGGECWAMEAAGVLESMIPEGSEIGMTSDHSERDQFDRLLRYLWVGPNSVNEQLVRQGAAISRRYPPDTSMADLFEAAQTVAKTERLGLWASDSCGPSANADLRISDLVADAPGNDNENLNGEWVVIRNAGNNVVDMTGWGIKDESASHRFQFPAGFSLSPGDVVTVYSGCGKDAVGTLYWCEQGSAIWNNDGDTVFLTDPDGNTHTSRQYMP